LPGFIELHTHAAEGGLERGMLDLSGVDGEAARVEAERSWPFTHPADAWIEGAGVDPSLLDGLRPLATLHRTSTERARVLASVDGHSAFVVGAALQAAGLNPAGTRPAATSTPPHRVRPRARRPDPVRAPEAIQLSQTAALHDSGFDLPDVESPKIA
jgi:predicted amidohydrolase YtcJ